MENPFDDILFLLQHCIIGVDNNAWETFLLRFSPLVKKSCAISDYNKRNDFVDWFPGWLIQENSRRLQAANKKLKSIIDEGKLITNEEKLEWFKSYFTHIVRSGVSAFFNEQNQKLGNFSVVSLDEEHNDSSTTLHNQIKDNKPEPQQKLQIKEDKERLKNSLSQLELNYRVPFVLTCCYDFHTKEDIAWISDQCGKTPSQVENLIENELLFNSKKKHPISAPFIGALLNIENDTVAQRVRRARIKLRSLLSNK